MTKAIHSSPMSPYRISCSIQRLSVRQSTPSFPYTSVTVSAKHWPQWSGITFALGLLAFGLAISLADAQEPAPMNAAPAAQAPPETAPPMPMPMPQAEPMGLPADYKPPRAIPPVMDHNKELTTDAQDQSMRTELERQDKYKTAVFGSADASAKGKAIVDKWAKWRMNQLTLKSNHKRLHQVRDEIVYDISLAGNSSRVNRKQAEEFRNYLCDQVTQRATELLDNNFHVRLNAVIILAQLNLTDESKDIPEQAYGKAAIPLITVINTPTGGGVDEQLEAVKIQAAIGLGRINLLAPPADLAISVQGQNLRNLIANTLIAQLQDPKTNSWYQMRLCESLASIDLINDVTSGLPIIVKQLSEVLADREREFCVRARAARSLGRCVLPPGVNTEKLVFQIVLLEHEMALAYQKRPNEYYWMDCFLDVYFAFRPVTDTENQLYGSKRLPGLSQKNLGNLVREGYQQILPITNHVINQKGFFPPKEGEPWAKNAPIPAQLISDLGKWLQDHQPASHKLTPNLPDLDPQSPLPTASAGTTTGG